MMKEEDTTTGKSSLMMTGNESAIYLVESFMEDNYAFRRNLLSGKTEVAVCLTDEEGSVAQVANLEWEVLTKEKVNSIVRKAKKMGVGGKSSFAVRLLPEQLRQYFLDHINFANKFDSEIAFTHNLYVNIDEFANMGPTQQGKAQADRPRYASFLATTNDEHPLCDPTGSHRYLCLHIPSGQNIDNVSDIDYAQLYAQVMYELQEQYTPYWFTNDQILRIQEQIFDVLHVKYPMLVNDAGMKMKIGQMLRYMGGKCKHTKVGQAYLLVKTDEGK